jgi:hypothetical protein
VIAGYKVIEGTHATKLTALLLNSWWSVRRWDARSKDKY